MKTDKSPTRIPGGTRFRSRFSGAPFHDMPRSLASRSWSAVLSVLPSSIAFIQGSHLSSRSRDHRSLLRCSLMLPAFLQKLGSCSGEEQTKLALKLVSWPSGGISAERMKMRLEHLVPLSRQAVVVLAPASRPFWQQPQHFSLTGPRWLYVQQHDALCSLPHGISRPGHYARLSSRRFHDPKREQSIQS
jgi:hypothetical protein